MHPALSWQVWLPLCSQNSCSLWQEMIGDEDGVGDLEKWRQFIKSEAGVELIIHA